MAVHTFPPCHKINNFWQGFSNSLFERPCLWMDKGKSKCPHPPLLESVQKNDLVQCLFRTLFINEHARIFKVGV